MQYLGQMRVWPGATLDGTTIGGLSGISYDPGRQLYYIVSDDRSAKNPARFYTARISLADNGIERLTDVPGGPVLLDPWVRVAGLDGRHLGEFALPPTLKMSTGQTGAAAEPRAGRADVDAQWPIPLSGDGRARLQRRRTARRKPWRVDPPDHL